MDYTNDEIYRTVCLPILQENRIPDYADLDKVVKTASDRGAPPYADESRQEYPIGSAGETWHSMAHCILRFDESRNPEVYQTVKKAAAIHGIEGDLEALIDFCQNLAEAPGEKQAAAKDLEIAVLDGTVRVKISSVVEDSKKLESLRNKIPEPDFVKMAKTIVSNTPEDQVVNLPWVIQSLGTEYVPEISSSVFSELRNRKIQYPKSASEYEECQALFEKLSADQESDSLDIQELSAAVEKLAGIDYANGVMYGSLIPSPYELTSSGMPVAELLKLARESVPLGEDMDRPIMVPVNELVKLAKSDKPLLYMTPSARESFGKAAASENPDTDLEDFIRTQKPGVRGQLLNDLLHEDG